MGNGQLGATGMKVLILGSSGIIGQHCRLCVPDDIRAYWHRCGIDELHISADLTNEDEREMVLSSIKPDVILNLAGESSTDAVEEAPDAAYQINVRVPLALAKWCDKHGKHLIHVSTQAVFGGVNPPYSPDSGTSPINAYGRQKDEAEMKLWQFQNWTIVRPTFILGVRPMPCLGRRNPAEAMLDGATLQVNDRWFSPLYAGDAARLLWEIIQKRPARQIVHLGEPISVTRFQVAVELGAKARPVSNDHFTEIAPRPIDTTYAFGSRFLTPLRPACREIERQWRARKDMTIEDRAREISFFLGMPEAEALARLQRGFAAAHGDVAADFRAANPRTDAALLDWYKNTESYIWELSVYHADPGWNYAGMCAGFLERLRAEGRERVLALGDGIGDLTLTLRRGGIDAVYHDLEGSRTAEFARFRYWRHMNEALPTQCTSGWTPDIGYGYDAIISLDFLEHVTDVEAWAKAIRSALKPGGVFAFQNAFNIGSGDHGSIPCHLSRNDNYETDWLPLITSLGFEPAGGGNWWKVESEVAVAA